MKRRFFVVAGLWILATVAAVVAVVVSQPTTESGPDLEGASKVVAASGVILAGLVTIWEAATVWRERTDARNHKAEGFESSIEVEDAGFSFKKDTLMLRVWLRNVGPEPLARIAATVHNKAGRFAIESMTSTEGSLASIPVGPLTAELRVPLGPFQKPGLDSFGGLRTRGPFVVEPWLSIRLSFEGPGGLRATRSFSFEVAASGPVIAD